MISDFYEEPETIVHAIEPLRFHGNEVVLFHVLDPQEIRPVLKGPAILVDLETEQRDRGDSRIREDDVSREDGAHIEQLRSRTRAAGMDYHLLVTDQPLDAALREYLSLRQAGN